MGEPLHLKVDRGVIAYLLSETPTISKEDKLKILYNAAKMYEKDGQRRSIGGLTFDGFLISTGERKRIHGVVGKCVRAEIYSENGRNVLELIVSKENDFRNN